MSERVMYGVFWDDGKPCIESGPVVRTGKTARSDKVRLDDGQLYSAILFRETIKEAIENEILRVSSEYGTSIIPTSQLGKPWRLLKLMTKLYRLAIEQKLIQVKEPA